MDIPRKKDRARPDKLRAELLFFCFWLTRCGEVLLDRYDRYGQHSLASYRRYAKELQDCGAVPRLALRGKGDNRRFTSVPPVEDFEPQIRFDLEDEHLRRLPRLVCMAAAVLMPDGEFEAFDNSIEEYRAYTLQYPNYRAAYEGLDRRTFFRDKRLVCDVLLQWRTYDADRMQRDEEDEAEIMAEFTKRLKAL